MQITTCATQIVAKSGLEGSTNSYKITAAKISIDVSASVLDSSCAYTMTIDAG